jgi:hypothetical protein
LNTASYACKIAAASTITPRQRERASKYHLTKATDSNRQQHLITAIEIPYIACPRGSSQQRENDRPCLDPARENSTGGSTNLELLQIEFQMALNYFTGDEKYA